MNYNDYTQQLQSFDSSEGAIKYFDQGQGKTILLLHGVPTSSWLYRNISKELVNKAYRVIAPDMLGYGSSDKPVGYDIYSPTKTGQRILQLMAHLGLDKWTQVFHDGGGLWTWEMLNEDASKIERLIMLNTIVYQGGFKPPIKFDQGLLAQWYTRLYCSKIGQPIAVNGTFKAGIKNRTVINPSMLDGYKQPLLKNGHRALYYFFTQTCKVIPDYSELHRSLDIPLHVIWGKHDKILVWNELKDQVKKNFKHFKSEDILDGKHFIQEENPEQLVELITKYMS